MTDETASALSDEIRDAFFGARRDAAEAARVAERATGAYAFLYEFVRRRYGLIDGDQIEDDGRLTRVPRPELPSDARTDDAATAGP